MNKSLLIGLVAVVLVGGAVLIFSNQNGNDAAMQKEEVMQKDDSAMEKKDTAMMEKSGDAMTDKKEDTMMKDESAMMKSGSYEAYGAEKIAMASDAHDVVLFFNANWCPSCRAVDADIRARLKDIPATLTILDVNYDDSSALKAKYGVTYQHTFVQVDAQGNQIKKWSGSPTLAALVAEVK